MIADLNISVRASRSSNYCALAHKIGLELIGLLLARQERMGSSAGNLQLTRSHRPVLLLYCLSTRAGAPTAMEKSGIERFTTELAPMTQCWPIVTPGRTTTFS